jgi:hypothetical protein
VLPISVVVLRCDADLFDDDLDAVANSTRRHGERGVAECAQKPP